MGIFGKGERGSGRSPEVTREIADLFTRARQGDRDVTVSFKILQQLTPEERTELARIQANSGE